MSTDTREAHAPVKHWLCGTVPYHSCGNCSRSIDGGPVGIRLHCWEGHHKPTFLMPTDGTSCSDFKAKDDHEQ